MLAEITRITGVEVREDRLTRYLYGTDGSIYEIEPLGVAFPRSEDDVVALVRWAGRHGVPLLPRGGATSLAGQTVGRALVIDLARHLNRIITFDAERRRVVAEPGVVADHINVRAGRHGLRWAPDPSTSNRATVGGMIGNNASGSRSIRYGMTADCVESLRVVLANGEVIETRPLAIDGPELAAIMAQNTLEASIYREVLAVSEEYADDIAARYPDIPRNNTGYDLRAAVRDGKVDLTRLICASEGTLGIVTAATLRLDPLAAHRALAVLVFDDLVDSMVAVDPLRDFNVSAIELIDKPLLDLGLQTPYRDVAAGFPANTAAILAVEVEGDDAAAVARCAAEIVDYARTELRGVIDAETYVDPLRQRRLWAMRKAAVPILFRVPGDAKPVPFIEDMAVATSVLPAYVRGLQDLFARHGADSTIYAHASVGCLHVRPILNLKSSDDVQRMAHIAAGACELVLSLGGAMTGEHGDGLSRSQWVRVMYGDRLWQAFRRIKQAFDAQGIFNPGKIVADDNDLTKNLRYGNGYVGQTKWTSVLDFSNQGSFQQAVELCNGCGGCRKTTGTMCPTFQALNEEIMSTRGRANLIRGALAGRLEPGVMFTPEFRQQVLDYCIGCKGCRVECPSGVDMTKIKAEVLHHYNERNGLSLRQRLLADVRRIYKVGSAFAPLSNTVSQWPFVRALAEKVAGIDRRRPLPQFAPVSLSEQMRRLGLDAPVSEAAPTDEQRQQTRSRRVLLFADCFNDYSHPQIGLAAVKIMQAVGVEVRLAPTPACCGRPAISEGMLDVAKEHARQNLAALLPLIEQGWELVGIEPSCTSVFKHELRELLGFADEGARKLAEATWDVTEYLAKLLDDGAFERLAASAAAADVLPGVERITFHAHCHQKSFAAHQPTARLLTAVTGLPVDVVDAGCCGMAGSFGYKPEYFDFSKQIANNVRRAIDESGGLLVASGTSCTTQFSDLYGWQALHPLEVLARWCG